MKQETKYQVWISEPNIYASSLTVSMPLERAEKVMAATVARFAAQGRLATFTIRTARSQQIVATTSI